MNTVIHKNIFVYMLFVGMLFIQIATPLKATQFVSLGVTIIFATSLCIFLWTLLTERNLSRYTLLAAALIAIASISILITLNSFSEAIMHTLIFLEIPLFLCSIDKKTSAKISKTLYWTYFVLSIYYIGLSFSPLAYIYKRGYGATNISSLTLGYGNPNETALHLFICVLVLLIWYMRIKKRLHRLIIMLDIAYLCVLVWLTESRTIMLLLLLVGVCVIGYRTKIFKNIPKTVVILAMIIPIIFPIITLVFGDWLRGVSLFGDSVETGRSEIYYQLFQNMEFKQFLFGKAGMRFQNLHNGILTVFASFGFLGALVFFSFIYGKIFYLHKSNKNGLVNNIAFIGLLAAIIATSTEAALLISGSAFAAETITLFLLCTTEGGETT